MRDRGDLNAFEPKTKALTIQKDKGAAFQASNPTVHEGLVSIGAKGTSPHKTSNAGTKEPIWACNEPLTEANLKEVVRQKAAAKHMWRISGFERS
ncbi:MAG: hypothetical protein ACRDJI_11410 [Actinomycetota bacterium]